MRARAAQGQVDQRDGGLPARHHEGVQRAFQLAHARPQLQRGGRAVQAIGVALVAMAPVVGHVGLPLEQHGGTAMGGHGQRGETATGQGLGLDEPGAPMHGKVSQRRVRSVIN